MHPAGRPDSRQAGSKAGREDACGLSIRFPQTVGRNERRNKMTRHDLRHQGEAMLRTLFGSAAQPAGLANLLTEAAYGGIWSRPGLALPDRLVCAIAALGAGPRLKALRRHIAAGLEHG